MSVFLLRIIAISFPCLLVTFSSAETDDKNQEFDDLKKLHGKSLSARSARWRCDFSIPTSCSLKDQKINCARSILDEIALKENRRWNGKKIANEERVTIDFESKTITRCNKSDCRKIEIVEKVSGVYSDLKGRTEDIRLKILNDGSEAIELTIIGMTVNLRGGICKPELKGSE